MLLASFQDYIGSNFFGNGSYLAGMNFTNLVIAIPLVATILLLTSNFIRTKFAKHIPNGIFECKFISITLICYVLILVVTTNLFNYQLSVNAIFVVLIGYAVFLSLSWCICRECDFTHTDTKINADTTIPYKEEFLHKITQKIENVKTGKNAKNILINGSWGAGKSHFIKNDLVKTTPLVYMSCTDYADTHELISALIEKTNNCLFRWLVRLSITRILAILGKFELRQFIGINKVIIFDEFERLVDYNKIDPMHIVSLIQYLNNEKNCICILVANDDQLNNTSQFTNVREKLISSIYHYRLSSYEDVTSIIKGRNSLLIDLAKEQFQQIYWTLNEWYQIDNNIRMIEHLYIKIDQLYQATLQMIDTDDFYKERFNDNENNRIELFTGLFTYVKTVIIQLYYLYLKNPYFLSVIGKFAEIHHEDIFIKKDTSTTKDNKKNTPYFTKNSLQQLAAQYTERDDYQKYRDFMPCISEILSNEIFANINQNLIIDYIANLEFIIGFLEPEEISQEGTRQSIQFFMRKFKETICESDDSNLIITYFKRINILEQRFLGMINAPDLARNSHNYNAVIDYINYVQYLIQNSTQTTSAIFNKKAYINALIIKNTLDFENGQSHSDIVYQIKEYFEHLENKDSSVLKELIYKNTLLYIKHLNKINEFASLISRVFNQLVSDSLGDTMFIMAGIECMNDTYYDMLPIIADGHLITDDKKLTIEQEALIKFINQEMINIYIIDFNSYSEWNKANQLDWIICKMCDLNYDSQNKFIKSDEFTKLYSLVENSTINVKKELANQYEIKNGIRGEIRDRIQKSLNNQ